MAVVSYQVEPLDGAAHLVLQSELVANEQLPPPGGDPRGAAALDAPLRPEEHGCQGGRAVLIHRARRSGLRVAVGMHNQAACPADIREVSETRPDLARYTVSARLEPANGCAW